jgi:5-methylcytosine-specific restriction endonuclease McrA
MPLGITLARLLGQSVDRCFFEMRLYDGDGTYTIISGKRKGYWRRQYRLLKEKGYKCARCGATTDLDIDHIMPRSAGGSSRLENLQFLCRSCHVKKTDEDEEAMRKDYIAFVKQDKFKGLETGLRKT